MLGEEDKTHGIPAHVELVDAQPYIWGGPRLGPPATMCVVHLMGTPAGPGAMHGCLTRGRYRGGRRDALTKGTCTGRVLAATKGAVAPTISAHVALSTTMIALANGERVWSHLHGTEV